MSFEGAVTWRFTTTRRRCGLGATAAMLVGLATLGTLACTKAPFPREEMLEDLVQTRILPLNDEFVRRCEALASATAALDAAPSSTGLESVRSAWREAFLSWQETSLYRFDRMMVLHSPIARRPPDLEFLEEVLAGDIDDIDDDFVARLGSRSKGLAAMEFLLYGAGSDESVDGVSTIRTRLAAALARELAGASRAIRDDWLPAGRNYAVTFVGRDDALDGFRRSFGALVNRVVAVLEETIRDDLGQPLGSGGPDGARPEMVRAPWSGESLTAIEGRLEGLERTFVPLPDPTGSEIVTLMGYLDHLDAEWEGRPMSMVLGERFAAARQALGEVPGPLAEAVVADTASVESAYDALRALLVLIKVDMANQLGITITFNDNDGD